MAVRCSKCGEELLGAVNRCWKCGHTFALRLESDGRPPVRANADPIGSVPLEARVLEPGEPMPTAAAALVAPMPVAPAPRSVAIAVRPVTSDVVDARRASIMAMGGTVASLVLGVFATALSMLWPPAAAVAVLGLALGIWGLGSQKRNLALIGMLICCLAIGIGAFGGARAIVIQVKANRPIEVP